MSTRPSHPSAETSLGLGLTTVPSLRAAAIGSCTVGSVPRSLAMSASSAAAPANHWRLGRGHLHDLGLLDLYSVPAAQRCCCIRKIQSPISDLADRLADVFLAVPIDDGHQTRPVFGSSERGGDGRMPMLGEFLLAVTKW